jgi:hypothetical protein
MQCLKKKVVMNEIFSLLIFLYFGAVVLQARKLARTNPARHVNNIIAISMMNSFYFGEFPTGLFHQAFHIYK